MHTISQTLAAGGSVLIPVFALGKLQEILSMVWDAMRDGRIPTVDIYTGGMGRRISEVYDQFATSASRTRSDDSIKNIPQRELPRRDGLFSAKFFREPSIVLASSGMMQEGTASYLLAQRWLREANFAICFVGYTDPRTPGYVVSHATRGERIRFGSMRRDVPVRCTIERFRFSAHARRDELLSIVERLRPKQVVLTHGDEQAMSAFGQLILESFPETIVSAPELGKWYRLLGEE
jgi:cleavage and polyadenylation specificity factor subunit 3